MYFTFLHRKRLWSLIYFMINVEVKEIIHEMYIVITASYQKWLIGIFYFPFDKEMASEVFREIIYL